VDGGIRVDVVGLLIERIEGLIQALKETDGLRLYSSSLLLVYYKGARGDKKVDVRLILLILIGKEGKKMTEFCLDKGCYVNRVDLSTFIYLHNRVYAFECDRLGC
jgi:hypothetical protein